MPHTACLQLAAWAHSPLTDGLTMSVDVSAHQFRPTQFVDRVLEVIGQAGAQPPRLKPERTESMLADDVDEMIGKMSTLKTHGTCFSLDDFGNSAPAICAELYHCRWTR